MKAFQLRSQETREFFSSALRIQDPWPWHFWCGSWVEGTDVWSVPAKEHPDLSESLRLKARIKEQDEYKLKEQPHTDTI